MDQEQWKTAYRLAEEKDKDSVKRAMLLENLLVKDYSMVQGVTLEEAESYLRDERKIFRLPYVDSHNTFFNIFPNAEGLKLLSEITAEAVTAGLAECAYRVMIPNLTAVDTLVWATWRNSPNGHYFPSLQREVLEQDTPFTLERATYREDAFKRITLHFGYKPEGVRAQKIANQFTPGDDTDILLRHSK